MELSDYLRAGLKELQNKRILVSHLDNMQQQMQRRRSTRLQNLMNLRKINESTLSPIITPVKVQTPKKLSKKISNRSDPQVENKVIKVEKKHENNQQTDKRRALLIKWKEEKNKKLQLEKNNKKPVFKVSHPVNLPSIDSANQFIKGKRITPKSKAATPSIYKFAPKNHVFKPPDNIEPIYFKNSLTRSSDMPIIKNTVLPQKDEKITVKGKRRLDFKSDKNKSKTYNSTVKPKVIETRRNLMPLGDVNRTSSNNSDVVPNKYIRADNSTTNKIKNQLVKQSPRLNSLRKPTESSKNKVKKDKTEVNNKTTKKLTDESKTIVKSHSSSSIKNLKNVKKLRNSTPKKISSLSTVDKTLPLETEKVEEDNSAKNNKKKNKTPENRKKRKEISQETSKSSEVKEKVTCTFSKSPKSPSVTRVSNNYLPQTPKNNDPPTYISPFITLSRGKDSARKEYKQRLSKGGTVENSNLSDYTSPKAAAKYFTHLLNSEISEILDMCKEWELHKRDDQLPDGACDMIDVAIGQSHLLINQKLEQFRGLIRSAESIGGGVTCHDLHGFWDLVNIQIKNVKDRFSNLKRLQDNQWEEIISVKIKTPAKKKNLVCNKIGRRKVDSKIKGLIEAARQKKKLQESPSKSLRIRSSSTPINLNNSSTAARSILRSGKAKSSKKRHKSVLFETTFEDNPIINSVDCENIENVEPRKSVKKTITFSPENSKLRRSSRLNSKL